MQVIGLAVVLAVSLTLTSLVGEAQQVGKVYRVGVPGLQARHISLPFVKAVEDGLRELGYVPGQNVLIEYRTAEGRIERLPEIVAELVRLPVDVIVTGQNELTVTAMQATKTIPIVTALAGDPIGSGLVASLARPGGNVTGLTFDAHPETYVKPLELLKEALPAMTRVAIIRNPDFPSWRVVGRAIEANAERLGITLSDVDIRTPRDLEGAFSAVRRHRADAILLLPDHAIYSALREVAERAVQSHVVAASVIGPFATAGGLLAYGPNMFDLFRRTAHYIDKIFKGARPSDLPMEQPTKFELVINLKTAKALGLTIPPSLLQRADQIIQ